MPDKLLRAIDAATREQDRVSAAFARELASVLRDVERQVRALLDQADAGGTGAAVQAGQLLRIRDRLHQVLRASGFDELAAAATSEGFTRITSRTLATRRIAGAAATLGPQVSLTLGALRALHLEDLFTEGEVLTRAITQAVTRGMLGAQAASDIIRDVAETLEVSERKVATLYDTAVTVYARQIEALQASPGDDTAFLYAGPVDDVTRDFCLDIVGKVFTRAEIDEMDNEQLPDVFLTGGGYNCRHTWVEISKFSELQDLVGTGRRVPEIEEQLQRAKEAA